MTSEPCWRIIARETLAWRSWDGRIVLYDERTGDTHYFDALTAEIFEDLLETPRSGAALVAVVADRLDLPCDATLAESVGTALERLAAIGIARPVAG
jgi:PqqD family protein of HPr-rel-A system